MVADPDPRFEGARALWAGRFQAVLATQSLAEPGYPCASVVPYCLDREGHALLLLSHLAQHTKNLGADPRCGLSVSQASDGDVQQSLRLYCPADCEPVEPADRASHARWFRYYPASVAYYEQLNFRLYRLRPRRFHCNGGFANARWLGNERVMRQGFENEQEVRALAALLTLPSLADSGPLEGPDSAGRKPRGGPPRPRLAGVDPWGLDVARGEQLRRIPLPGPIDTADDLLAVLSAMPMSHS
jgi:heme iron utilization protein